jgi:hypothetical protein
LVAAQLSNSFLKGYWNGLWEKKLWNKKSNIQKRQKENQEVESVF